jgi:DUF1680 family protein
MKPTLLSLCGVAVAACSIASAQTPANRTNAKPDYAVMPVPFKNVQITDAFWTPRLENNRNVSVPKLFEHYGDRPDLRLIEAACYLLQQKPDPALQTLIDSKLDRQIESIRRCKGVWSSEGDGDFLWAGNFLETSVAYFEATGSRKLLDVAIEIADDLDATFGPNKRHDISNHEGIKIGLVRLYRCTGDDKYLKLARFFLDARGNSAGRTVMYGPYAQDQMPVASQTRAIGHSVRATYLYMPLTDLAALTGDPKYSRASELIWEDAMAKRTFLTGGVGSYRDEEDFGDDYDLPNLACWNEICAAYGNALWDQKQFLLRQEAKYSDAMELVLYNAFLVGVSLDGSKYLYQAPLKTYSAFSREPWFGPNCCPPNVARLLAQFGNLIYSQSPQSVYVNLFVASKADVKLKDNSVTLTQEGNYPWDGVIKLTVNPEKVQKFPLYVRIPGWVRGQPMAGQLYRYAFSQRDQEVAVTVNGIKATYALDKGYAKMDREWKGGDVVQFTFPMPVRRVLASDRVADDKGMVAIQRGPVIYCLERADNPGGIFNLVLPDTAPLQFAWKQDLLGGIGTITGAALAAGRGPDHVSVVAKPQNFTAIPYYAFGNRTNGEMTVWLAHDEAHAKVPPKPSIASTSKASSSCGNGTVAENYPGHNPPTTAKRMYPLSQDGSGDISVIYDQMEPVNSEDGSAPFLRLHPQSGSTAWVEYDFSKPEKVSTVEVYWKDDKQFCVLPKSWRISYKDGNNWTPVDAFEPYTITKDKFNKTTFLPVTTSGLRLEITLQEKVYKKGDLGPPDANYLTSDLPWFEGGVIEWRVNP